MNNKNIYRLVLGTAQFGMNYGIANKTGQPSTDEIAKILNLARHHGIHMIDTAIAYGDSEKNLGEVGLEGFEIVTKLPEIPDNTDIESWILAEVQSSLARLRVKQLYGLLLHKPQQINTRLVENIINTLGILKKEKLVKKIGVSVYSPEELSNILTRFIPDIVQLPFNLIDQRFLCTGWFDKLQERNIEVHSRSVFLQGLLLMPYQEVTQKFNRWHQLWNTWFDWLQASKCHQYVLPFALY